MAPCARRSEAGLPRDSRGFGRVAQVILPVSAGQHNHLLDWQGDSARTHLLAKAAMDNSHFGVARRFRTGLRLSLPLPTLQEKPTSRTRVILHTHPTLTSPRTHPAPWNKKWGLGNSEHYNCGAFHTIFVSGHCTEALVELERHNLTITCTNMYLSRFVHNFSSGHRFTLQKVIVEILILIWY